MTIRATRSMLVAIAATTLIAACSGSDDSGDATTDASTATTVERATPSSTIDIVVTTDGSLPAADPADVQLADQLLSRSIQVNLGLSPEQADCAAVLMVDAIGANVLLDGGELVDLDSLGAEYQQKGADGLAAAIGDCGIDPTALGG